MNVLLVFLAGVLIVGGILLGIRAFIPTPVKEPTPRRRPRTLTRLANMTARTKTLIVIGIIAGIVAAAISGILLLIVVVPIAVIGLPLVLGKQDTRERDMLSALEGWSRSLAAASATGRLTLRQVIWVTRTSTPEILRPGVDRMNQRMLTSWTAADALRAFGEELDSAWVDEVVIYMIQAADYSSNGLADALNTISENLAAQVKLRAEVYKEREKPRRVMIQITAIVGVVLALVALFARTPQLSAFSTPIGQLALAVVLASLAVLLFWARAIGRPKPEPRFLLTGAR